MNIELKRGQVLVLVGTQGCGKSVLARAIAAKYGSVVEIDADRLASYFGLGSALTDEPVTIIVDGNISANELNKLKAIVSCDTIGVDVLGVGPRVIKSPNIILCMQEFDVTVPDDDRRFNVVRLS